MATRICRECSVLKPMSEYHLDRHKRLEYRCKTCKTTYATSLRRNKSETELKELNARVRSKYDPLKQRLRRLKGTYGLTQDEVYSLWVGQHGKCGSCNLSLEFLGGAHVDHNHATGQVRGFLCGNCNIALGHLHESEEKIVGLLTYLQRTT